MSDEPTWKNRMYVDRDYFWFCQTLSCMLYVLDTWITNTMLSLATDEGLEVISVGDVNVNYLKQNDNVTRSRSGLKTHN